MTWEEISCEQQIIGVIVNFTFATNKKHGIRLQEYNPIKIYSFDETNFIAPVLRRSL